MSFTPASTTRAWDSDISVVIKPYDKKELALLQKLPCWTDLEKVIGKKVEGQLNSVSTQQFLLYSLFRDLDCNSVDDLKSCVDDQERRFNRLLVVDGKIIRAKPDLEPTEHTGEANDLGIAFGLSVADLAFGTTEMDWKPIPVQRTKDNDYLGSNGTTTFDLEVKGSFVDDPSLVAPTTSNHKTSIKDKKSAKGAAPTGMVRLGTIASIGKSGVPVLRIVDPPGEEAERSPSDQQLLNRMDSLSRWITCLSPRSSLAIALRGRSQALHRLNQIEELDELSLVTGDGETINTSPYQTGSIHSRFFATKSVVEDGPTGGIICRTETGVFFLGVMEDLLNLAVEQNFSSIRQYHRTPAMVSKTVRCTIPKGRKKEFGDLPLTWDESEQFYLRFEVSGDLHYTSGGLVFGWLVPH